MVSVQYVKIQTSDNILNRIQNAIQNAFNSIAGPFIGGNLLTGITLISGQNNLVPHNLGRNPQLWVISGQNTNSVVWSPLTALLGNSNSNSSYLNLQCSTSCVVSVWVN
jgi:hypothetical protein